MSRTNIVERFVCEASAPVSPTQVWSGVGFRPHGFLSHLVKMGRLHRLNGSMNFGKVGFNGSEEPRYWFRVASARSQFALVEGSRVKTALAIFSDGRNRRCMPEWMYRPDFAIYILDYLNLEQIALTRLA